MDYAGIRSRLGPPGAPWVCFFCTSDPEDRSSLEEAERLGASLARAGLVVVTGGYGAAMEAASRGAKEAGGYTVGVTCRIFTRPPNQHLSAKVETDCLLDRLETLLRLGDGYIAGKGGTGTLAEIALAWEYINKRIMPKKPLVLLGEFWARLPEIMRGAGAAPGVSLGRAGESIRVARDVEEAVALLARELPDHQSTEREAGR